MVGVLMLVSGFAMTLAMICTAIILLIRTPRSDDPDEDLWILVGI